MPTFLIKVPNRDDGEDLGEYESDYLPRVGDPFVFWHRRLCPRSDEPFCGTVMSVTHELFDPEHPYAKGNNIPSVVITTVWLTEEMGAPTLYCDCPDQKKYPVDERGKCERCGRERVQ